jgi:hypothetical protein
MSSGAGSPALFKASLSNLVKRSVIEFGILAV